MDDVVGEGSGGVVQKEEMKWSDFMIPTIERWRLECYLG